MAGDLLCSGVQAAVEAAEAAWPSLRLDRAAFGEHVASKLAGTSDRDPLARLRPVDLYLSFGCALGDAGALSIFEARCVPEIRAAVARLELGAAATDEIVDTIRDNLLAPRDGRPPRIATYGGRGDLRSWLAVTATRAALRLGGKERAALPEDALGNVAAPGDDPEWQQIKAQHRDGFHVAFREAVSSLTNRERNLLRYKFLERLTGDEIAAIYRVHRATVVRWLAKAEQTVFTRTRKNLATRLGLDGGELESFLRLIPSRLDLSLSRVLQAGTAQ
jgi:RNA polymerase sigma-70 factor (ECF subfamily)